ncbi:unnamed protein product, partial [Candidula unifasciata]
NLIIQVTVADENAKICQCPDAKTFVEGNTLPTCPTCGKNYPAVVRYDALDSWCHGESFTVCNCLDNDNNYSPLPPDEIVERAKSLLGPIAYDVFQYNCEHFALWCRYGVAASFQ